MDSIQKIKRCSSDSNIEYGESRSQSPNIRNNRRETETRNLFHVADDHSHNVSSETYRVVAQMNSSQRGQLDTHSLHRSISELSSLSEEGSQTANNFILSTMINKFIDGVVRNELLNDKDVIARLKFKVTHDRNLDVEDFRQQISASVPNRKDHRIVMNFFDEMFMKDKNSILYTHHET